MRAASLLSEPAVPAWSLLAKGLCVFACSARRMEIWTGEASGKAAKVLEPAVKSLFADLVGVDEGAVIVLRSPSAAVRYVSGYDPAAEL